MAADLVVVQGAALPIGRFGNGAVNPSKPAPETKIFFTVFGHLKHSVTALLLSCSNLTLLICMGFMFTNNDDVGFGHRRCQGKQKGKDRFEDGHKNARLVQSFLLVTFQPGVEMRP